ncbi:putative F-box domain-containing protein [Helianthus debilis subsp. tardiflorus]
MSANIPFEIQEEIIKRVLPVKSLIQFRSVSKQWKSLIHSPEFIADHSVNPAQPYHLLVSYTVPSVQVNYVSIVDDDSFPHHKFSPNITPTAKLVTYPLRLASCHGLVFLYGYSRDLANGLIVLWNPSIRKSVGIASAPYGYGHGDVFGFGVCPKTSDPTIVKITYLSKPYKAEVFTLSSGAWKSISMNLPYKSLYFISQQVVIDGVIHWAAFDTSVDKAPCKIISFDLTTKEFGEVELPDRLAWGYRYSHISKLNESLSVVGYLRCDGRPQVCDVWVLSSENGNPKPSFTQLFTLKVKPSVNKFDYTITRFRKNGQPIFEHIPSRDGSHLIELGVYEPCSEHINGHGTYGLTNSYTESLHLLNHADSIIQ